MKYVGTYSDPKDIVTKDKLEDVASRVSTNEDNIAMAESDIEALQTDVGTLKTNVGNIQTALTSKQDTIVGGASTITEDNLTASRALISNSSGKVAVSAVTSTELGYLDGVTSNVQTQLNGKQPKITVNGIIQGDGTGNLSAAELNPASVGLGNVDNVKQYSASNPPPYPVTSVNGKTGVVTLSATDVSAIPSTLAGTAGQVLTKTDDGQAWTDVTPRDICFHVSGFLQTQDLQLLDPIEFSSLTYKWNQIILINAGDFQKIDIPMPCIDAHVDNNNAIILRYAGIGPAENQAIFTGIYYDAVGISQHAVSLLYQLGKEGFQEYNIIPVRNIDPSTTTPLAPTEFGAVGTSTAYARGDHNHPKELPTVTTSDNGKFLRVVNGAWAAVEIANANGGSF